MAQGGHIFFFFTCHVDSLTQHVGDISTRIATHISCICFIISKSGVGKLTPTNILFPSNINYCNILFFNTQGKSVVPSSPYERLWRLITTCRNIQWAWKTTRSTKCFCMSLHCSLFVLVSPVLQNAWVHPKCLWMIGYADVQQGWKGKSVIFKPGFHVYIFRSVNDHQQKFLNRPSRSPRLATATYSTGAAPSAKALTPLRKRFPRETFLSDDVTRSLTLKACER